MFVKGFAKIAEKNLSIAEKAKLWAERGARTYKPLPPGKPKIIRPGFVKKLSSEITSLGC